MKILIATDSFKDALPAIEVCKAIECGIKLANPNIETILFPLGDGGEGTSEILTFHSKGKWIKLKVHDPLFRLIEAGYGISADGSTAFIEMAQAAGLQLLKFEDRNPLKTSTYGVGEMILDAIKHGARNIVLCIGGSATNDAGIGMAGALGYEFINHSALSIDQLTGENLSKINEIHHPPIPLSHYHPITPSPNSPITTTVLCDVDNPLFGPSGAAHIYARQKGADDAAITELDTGLQHFAKILEQHFGRDFAQIPGAGAAGGLGAGAMAFLNAELKPGIETVLELTEFDQYTNEIDLIITGEGKIDSQTLHGKLISGIVKKSNKIPVIALCGTLLATPQEIEQIGLKAAFSILNRPMDLETALAETARLLEQSAFQLVRAFEH
ncbi:MAG: glycerate kinase [Saprospiraceae bacterium]|nr:glycerate kinase [Saprospiraceae bacterium]